MPDEKDYKKAAEESLELAQVLVGKATISDQDFLEKMARSDSLIAPGEEETCGMSCNIRMGAQVAREMIEAGEWENVVSKWAVESRRRWENSKFVKLWQASQAAGRDPEEEIQKRGWGT